jgi:replicative DNA helicase
MSVLGAMMLEKEVIGLVLPIVGLEESHFFYRPDHRTIYETLVGLYNDNKAVDLIVMKDELDRRGVLVEIGGAEYLVQLVESVPSSANAEFYARIVKDKAMLRALISAAGEIAAEAYNPVDTAAEILDRAEQKLFHVTDLRISQHATLIRGDLDAVFAQIESREGHYLTGLPSGYNELDDLTTGFQNGELIVIAARPSMGKTALGLCIAEYVTADEKKPVAFFSMEMSRQQIAQRMLCSRGSIDASRLRRGMLSEEDIEKLKYVCNDMCDMPLYVDDTPGMTVLELRAKVRRLWLQEKIAAVFIDYLQLMHTPGAESRQQEIAEISRGLKALARELSIPVIAMAQLNRMAEGREGNRPRMSDLRESGAIEQDADVILLLHREEYFLRGATNEEKVSKLEEVRGKAEIIVAKQRNGPTGTVHLQFAESHARFSNLAYVPEPDPTLVEHGRPAPPTFDPAASGAPF